MLFPNLATIASVRVISVHAAALPIEWCSSESGVQNVMSRRCLPVATLAVLSLVLTHDWTGRQWPSAGAEFCFGFYLRCFR